MKPDLPTHVLIMHCRAYAVKRIIRQRQSRPLGPFHCPETRIPSFPPALESRWGVEYVLFVVSQLWKSPARPLGRSCPALNLCAILRPLGEWRSLVAHLHGVQGVAGSNPVSPTHLRTSSLLRIITPPNLLSDSPERHHFADSLLDLALDGGLDQVHRYGAAPLV